MDDNTGSAGRGVGKIKNSLANFSVPKKKENAEKVVVYLCPALWEVW